MHHYDSKHYIVSDDSDAHGLTIRLDHGRAFCSFSDDELDVMLAPIRQCCTLRKETYDVLRGFARGVLARRWRKAMATDPLAPVMAENWFFAIERRLQKILELVDECAKVNNGIEHVLV